MIDVGILWTKHIRISSYLLTLLSLIACYQSEPLTENLGNEALVFDLPTDSIQIFDESAAGVFFNRIFSQYPDDYYPFNAGVTFSESISTGVPDSYHTKSSFLVVDSMKQGYEKYLLDITPADVSSLSALRIYSGRHGCHWELSLEGCPWMAFSNESAVDFIFNSDDGGYDSNFIHALQALHFNTTQEKEAFCSGILDALSLQFVPDYTSCHRSSIAYDWIEETLRISHLYADTCTTYRDGRPKEDLDFKHVMEFQFVHNKITGLNRLIEE